MLQVNFNPMNVPGVACFVASSFLLRWTMQMLLMPGIVMVSATVMCASEIGSFITVPRSLYRFVIVSTVTEEGF